MELAANMLALALLLTSGEAIARPGGPKTFNLYIRNYFQPGDADSLARWDALGLDVDTADSVGSARELLAKQFGTHDLSGFGVAHLPLLDHVAGLLVEGNAGAPVVGFATAEVACLERVSPGEWRLAWKHRPKSS